MKIEITKIYVLLLSSDLAYYSQKCHEKNLPIDKLISAMRHRGIGNMKRQRTDPIIIP